MKHITRKKEFFENKSKECIGKPEDLWKAAKSLGQLNKSSWCIDGAFPENQSVKHDQSQFEKLLKFFIQTWQENNKTSEASKSIYT